MEPTPLSDDLHAALARFAAAHGRHWKQRLRDLWDSGQDDGELRALRNRLGPAGLARYRPPPPSARSD